MRTAVLLAMVVGLYCDFAVAQDGTIVNIFPQEDELFRESFDESRPVSGSALVGLRLGDAQGHVVPDNIVLLRPPSGKKFCVHSMTQDGRFSASNPYFLPEDAGPSAYLRLIPMTDLYGHELASYPVNQLAVRAFVPRGEGCSPAEAVHIPAVAAGSELNVLYVFVSSKTQAVSATLSGQGDGARVECEQAGTSAFIAYDQMCLIPITDPADEAALLELELDDGFSSQSYRYTVMLPDGN